MKPSEILEKRMGAIENAEICTDRRKLKGVNHYSAAIAESYGQIDELLKRGDSIRGIFVSLQNEGVFNDAADGSNFYKALKREQNRRKEAKIISAAEIVPVIKRAMQENIKTESEAKSNSGFNETTKAETPEGMRLIRGRHCPVIQSPDDETPLEERRFNFEDYPKGIQDAINESARNGRSIEDAPRNKKLVEEWKASLVSKKTD